MKKIIQKIIYIIKKTINIIMKIIKKIIYIIKKIINYINKKIKNKNIN